MANNLLRGRRPAAQEQRPPTQSQPEPWRMDEKSSVRKNLGDFMHGVARQKAMGATVGASGGFLVPPQLLVDVNMILAEVSVFHRYAWNVDMVSGTMQIPTYDLSAAHALGVTPLYGGINLAWGKENVALSETAPSFAMSELVAKNLQGIVLASDQLVNDGGLALGCFLERGFVESIKFFVELSCLQGVDANELSGVINSPATVAAARNAANDVKTVDLAKMIASLVPACFPRSLWLYHPSAVEKIAALSTYTISEPDYGLVYTLYGRPAFCTEKCSTLGTKGDVVLFDPQQYVLGHRQLEVSAAPSIDTPYVTTQQTIFRLIWRGDGKLLARNTVTLQNNTTVCGVAVALL